ncbi:gliding motility-associated C-terminal domain-containing protein [Marinilabiliaceae bacterium ANBcel2]|nr:gliding motility-associated C-terminal domain-containing protein [Marinilabiliaceae bacterium ANBcel2]
MRRRVTLYTISVILFLLFSAVTYSQIEATTAADSKMTQYSPQEPIFFYNDFETNHPLRYSAENSNANYTYQWYQYNYNTSEWDIELSTQSGAETFILISETGGYRLAVTKEDQSEKIYTCWVFTPDIINAELETIYEDCYTLEIKANIELSEMIYTDNAGNIYLANQKLYFQWDSDPETDITEMDSENPLIINAPYQKTLFTLSITDNLNNSIETEMLYNAIAVKASYEAEVIKAEIPNEIPTDIEGTPPQSINASGPVEIRFTDTSKGNITARQWQFGRVTRSEREPVNLFSEIGTQHAYLTVIDRSSPYNCRDSVADPLSVTIRESRLLIPNTFTPNGDGINDEFRVEYQSLKSFRMEIYNRWGRKVYESNDPSQGWDGKNGGSMSPPGVYFFYITAEGYEPDEKYKEQGPVHLIR